MNSSAHHSADREALQARFALRLTSALDSLPVHHDIEQRLRVARDQAVERARARRMVLAPMARAPGLVLAGAGQAALGGGSDKAPRWLSPSMAALALALVVGLFAVDFVHDQAQIDAAAEIDAALLADDLPPRAYTDAGFREYLRTPQD